MQSFWISWIEWCPSACEFLELCGIKSRFEAARERSYCNSVKWQLRSFIVWPFICRGHLDTVELWDVWLTVCSIELLDCAISRSCGGQTEMRSVIRLQYWYCFSFSVQGSVIGCTRRCNRSTCSRMHVYRRRGTAVCSGQALALFHSFTDVFTERRWNLMWLTLTYCVRSMRPNMRSYDRQTAERRLSLAETTGSQSWSTWC